MGALAATDQKICKLARYAIAATNADAGIMKIHAHTMFPATPQRTALARWTEPTPTMAPVVADGLLLPEDVDSYTQLAEAQTLYP